MSWVKDHLGAPWHPAKQRAFLRSLLKANRVVTLQQLRRWRLEKAAVGLPAVVLSGRTRATQPNSLTELTFVTVEPRWLDYPVRDLMHWAGLAEIWVRLGDRSPLEWHLVDARSRERKHIPDAELILPGALNQDTAYELDAGYALDKVRSKLIAYAEAGYSSISWGTTVHARVPRIEMLVRELFHQRLLGNVREVYVAYVNYWSEDDPYNNRPRCHKMYRALIRRQQ